jgi:hypothetical protein
MRLVTSLVSERGARIIADVGPDVVRLVEGYREQDRRLP